MATATATMATMATRPSVPSVPTREPGEMGTVYLLHFAQPVGNDRHHAQHYIGWARNLGARLKHHQNGTDARLTAYVAAAGITWVVAREWDGDRYLERRLKNQKKARRLCPVCQAARCQSMMAARNPEA
ncbi:MAG: hypothetical protein ACRDHE_09425 [Ktedonobacterales bacterium]